MTTKCLTFHVVTLTLGMSLFFFLVILFTLMMAMATTMALKMMGKSEQFVGNENDVITFENTHL